MTEPLTLDGGRIRLYCGDCLDVLRTLPAQSVDLVFGSPPYEDARTYGMGFRLQGQEWVDWTAERFAESLRVCRGLVAFVVEGRTKDFRWTATPALLMADLHRAGIRLRKPPIYRRVGIPGSGGPDWLRNDYEFIVCASHGRLPWSDNTAYGHPPIYGPGGAMSNRRRNGERLGRGNEKGGCCSVPEKANPANVIDCRVGGGRLGHPLAHENEAPFPLELAEFFIRSFCPLGGVVLDPFGGSGTTAHAAIKHGRRAVCIDVRPCQVALQERRLADVITTGPLYQDKLLEPTT